MEKRRDKQVAQQQDPIKVLIALGFGSLLTLMCVLAYISLSQMDNTIERMSGLVNDNAAKSRAVNEMRDYVRLRGSTLDRMYISDDPFEREQLRLKMSEYGQAYRDALADFLSFKLNSRELKEISLIRQITSDARQDNIDAAEMLVTKQDPGMVKAYFENASIARDRVIGALDTLVSLEHQNANTSLEYSVSFHKQTQTMIFIIAAIAFFVGVLISMLVIRETSRKNSAIRYQANHDALTKLVNRSAFELRLSHALQFSRENDIEHALCYLDLDQFKIINDTCGHKAGDELLKQITHVILNHVRDRDTLGRLGGDEFGLLLESCSVEKALEICEGIITVVKKHDFYWNERCYHVGVSIGVVPVRPTTENVAKILSEADMACYAAKDMGRSQVHVHETEGRHVKKMQQELSWVADIRSTIEANRFMLHAQPIVPCDNEQATMMYEVLLRIRDDEGNVVSPGQYLPAAERFSLMREVDMWVTREAIRFVSERYQDPSNQDIRLFINLSANSICDSEFCAHIRKMLELYPVPHHSLCFEVTETAAIKNIEQAIEVINELKQSHVKFALDDFGSGMSSLAYLKNLPVDYLKIDGSIVQNIDNDKVNRAMVAAVNEIGRVMDLKTIAEFVENSVVFDHIKSLNIDYAQGHFIAQPCPLEDIQTEWPSSNLQRI